MSKPNAQCGGGRGLAALRPDGAVGYSKVICGTAMWAHLRL